MSGSSSAMGGSSSTTGAATAAMGQAHQTSAYGAIGTPIIRQEWVMFLIATW